MFEDRADIQPFLAERELGRFAAENAALCTRSIFFEPDAARLGGRCFGGAPDVPAWTMLLQADMASLGTDYAEGTVYFVMRSAHLKQRDFSRVHGINQQT